MGAYKGRVCFDREEEIKFEIPEFDENDKETGDRTKKMVDREEFWELIVDYSLHKSQIPIYHLISRFKVCMVSVGSRQLEQLISMEAAARDYHVLPFGGGWLDQSNVVIEAFDIIRSTRNRFEMERLDKIDKG